MLLGTAIIIRGIGEIFFLDWKRVSWHLSPVKILTKPKPGHIAIKTQEIQKNMKLVKGR